MNKIQMLIEVSCVLLLLKLSSGNPIGDISTRSTDGHLGDESSSDCDTAHPYCCSPPLKSPTIPVLFGELNKVLNVLEYNNACTNSTFIKSVSSHY